jgi:hypothetical protein
MEDEAKRAIHSELTRDGWQVTIAWGHKPGIDIVAQRNGERLVLEAKGEGSHLPMRVNFFLGALGELLQRMDSPGAMYGLVLPAHRQYVGLILRLPAWVKARLGLLFYLVRRNDLGGHDVAVVPPEVVT